MIGKVCEITFERGYMEIKEAEIVGVALDSLRIEYNGERKIISKRDACDTIEKAKKKKLRELEKSLCAAEEEVLSLKTKIKIVLAIPDRGF